MNYKIVFFLLSIIGVVVLAPLAYWLIGLGGIEMSLIGTFWWIGLTTLSVLGCAFCATYAIYFLMYYSK